MGNFQLAALSLLAIFLAQASLAYTSNSVVIKDIVAEDLLINEVLNLHITNNTDTALSFRLPPDAYDVTLDAHPIEAYENVIHIPLECEICDMQISYVLSDVIKRFSSNSFVFSRTLNFPKNPALLNYTVLLPSKYFIVQTPDTIAYPIVPIPSETNVGEAGTLIQWSETTPVLPKVYQITFEDREALEKSSQEFTREFSEWAVWVIIIISVMLGAFFGIVIYKNLVLPKQRMMYVPSSLLSPDEKRVIKLLKHHKSKMNQKEIGKELHWSKSKVSAILSNLHYKEIIKKEKFGRNYKIELIKEIEKL